MSAIGLIGIGATTAGLRPSGTTQGRSAPAVSEDTPASPSGVNFSRADLLALNSGIDAQNRTRNALLTASDAIGVIGGLVESIQSALRAANHHHTAADTLAEQGRIDSAITTIDAIASSSRFGGKPLLTGSFSAGSVSLPSFVSNQLGTTQTPTTSTASLASLATGGELSLASGNAAGASLVVSAALDQVGQTQSQIGAVIASNDLSSPAPTTPSLSSDDQSAEPSDAMYQVASLMLAQPSLAALATANSSHAAALALLQP